MARESTTSVVRSGDGIAPGGSTRGIYTVLKIGSPLAA